MALVTVRFVRKVEEVSIVDGVAGGVPCFDDLGEISHRTFEIDSKSTFMCERQDDAPYAAIITIDGKDADNNEILHADCKLELGNNHVDFPKGSFIDIIRAHSDFQTLADEIVTKGKKVLP